MVNFEGAQFSGNAYFGKARFLDAALFPKSKFQGS
jgi:hypothetical protein